MEELSRRLLEGINALQVPGTSQQQERLLAFLFLLQKWNRVYNLTAIRDLREAIDLHLLDSLTVWPYLRGERILDAGTGAGLPGIPLAIMSENRNFTLVDRDAKKTRFVQQAVLELGLRNVEVVTKRIEQFHSDPGFDLVVARAYARLEEILEVARPLLRSGGSILAQKGRIPEMEIENLAKCAIRVHSLDIPGLKVERHLIEITID
jgi:16S rRNA (guanine527-N7)-methyltransferase